MEIYRVTVENKYSGKVLQSYCFATEAAAIKCAKRLHEELEADEDFSMHNIVVAAYAPDEDEEFFYDHDIEVYEL